MFLPIWLPKATLPKTKYWYPKRSLASATFPVAKRSRINEEEIIDILKNNIHDFSHNLKLKNKDLAYYENIEKKIEVLTTELGEKLSLF